MTPQAVFTVRVATDSDAPVLSQFAARVFREAFGAKVSPEAMDAYLADSFPEATVRRELSDPQTVFLFAETPDGTLTGYGKLFFGGVLPGVRGANPVKLWRLYTASEYQGQGVGATLLVHLVETARKRGAQTLWLTVNTGNAGAVRFYERHGFAPTGCTTFDLGGALQTDYLMERSLTPLPPLSSE